MARRLFFFYLGILLLLGGLSLWRGEEPGVPVRLTSSDSGPYSRSRSFPPPSSSFVVVAYNLNHGGGDIERCLDHLRRRDPDFALLQEVDRRLPRSGWRDQASYLARGLGQEVYFLPTLRRGIGSYGLAFLARKGWGGEARSLRLPGEGEPRFALLVEVESSRGRLVLGNIHLSVNREERIRQLLLLSRHLPPGPVILGGDWNTPPGAREMEPLRRLLPGAAFQGGDGFLYREMELLDFGVFPGEPSDHPLVWARFSFPSARL